MPADEQKEIEGTIAILRESLDGDLTQRAALDARIADKKQRISFWETKLGTLGAQTIKGEPRQRMPKGEPKRALLKAFKDHGGGLTQSALAQFAGLKWSTARGVLERDRDFKEVDGLWYRNESANGAAH